MFPLTEGERKAARRKCGSTALGEAARKEYGMLREEIRVLPPGRAIVETGETPLLKRRN